LSYNIDLDAVKKQFRYKEDPNKTLKIIHVEPKRAKFIPFNTKFNSDNLDFSGFVGDFSRKTINKKASKIISKDLINKMTSNILNLPEDKKMYMNDFFEELFFEDGQLLFTHPKLVFWLKESNNVEIAQFLVDIFMEEVEEELLEKVYSKEYTEDVLTKNLLSSLEEIKDSNIKKSYICKLSVVKKIFKEDFKFLMENKELFLEEFENFLKFYYFIYISQLTIKFNKFLDGNPEEFDELYFNLNWEKTSKTRISYLKGWKILEKVSTPLFTHRNLLEILNCNENKDILIYWDFKSKVKLSLLEEERVCCEIDEVIEWYKNSVDIQWLSYKAKEHSSENLISNKIKEFFDVIDYQFKNSVRKKPYDDYRKWLIEFAKQNFCKTRGPLGYTLNLNQDIVFLLTKLAMKKKEKIRIKDLYEEFQKRGVFLDKDSRESLEEYFENLNLIEKKSDSGDAVYVKSIL